MNNIGITVNIHVHNGTTASCTRWLDHNRDMYLLEFEDEGQLVTIFIPAPEIPAILDKLKTPNVTLPPKSVRDSTSTK